MVIGSPATAEASPAPASSATPPVASSGAHAASTGTPDCCVAVHVVGHVAAPVVRLTVL